MLRARLQKASGQTGCDVGPVSVAQNLLALCLKGITYHIRTGSLAVRTRNSYYRLRLVDPLKEIRTQLDRQMSGKISCIMPGYLKYWYGQLRRPQRENKS